MELSSTHSILLVLIFLASGVFWVFWNLLLFLFSFSAILLGDVIACKKRKIHEEKEKEEREEERKIERNGQIEGETARKRDRERGTFGQR